MLRYPCQRAVLKNARVSLGGRVIRLECKARGVKVEVCRDGDYDKLLKFPSDEEISMLIEKYCLHCNFEEEIE